jgi:hypothetical protein
MADMSQRHYKLIADAVVSGVEEIAETPAIKRQLDSEGDVLLVQRWVANLVSDALAKNLAYTNDNFDGNSFKQSIVRAFK